MENKTGKLPGILFITSYPPRACGIATFSQHLVDVLSRKFSSSFFVKISALETTNEQHRYPSEVIATLNTDIASEYDELVEKINGDTSISMVVIQHEFGFFHKNEAAFQKLLFSLNKPKILVLHTVLPRPDEATKLKVEKMIAACKAVVVMTHTSKILLTDYYDVPRQKIMVIPHGTHLVKHLNKRSLKKEYGFNGRKILSTFGLLNAGKSIETTLEAMPAIIKTHPEVLFLIIGKTHPVVSEREGEQYRINLEAKVRELKLQGHVRFINKYLELPDLMKYLQLTDVYLFTSKDPNQAVSGTFAYAMSCGCPIVSTPIPHAKEVLTEKTGMLFDFGNSVQLAERVNALLQDSQLRERIRLNAFQKIIPTAWENAAIAYARLFARNSSGQIILKYDLPELNLYHIRQMTTSFGIIQFAKINQPDKSSGYTIDDNARAMIALCRHYEHTGAKDDLALIQTYLQFIRYCQQKEGNFLNYVNDAGQFTDQNQKGNLEDANGRTVWALGYLISKRAWLPEGLITEAETVLQNALSYIRGMHSPRAISFAIKGLYYYNKTRKSEKITALVQLFADRLVELYNHESDRDWKWFEAYMTYANSTLPEAVLCAYLETGNLLYKYIAVTTFDFLLDHTFNEHSIKVISNKSWLFKDEEPAVYGEQPIDVAYTILALSRFHEVFKNPEYLHKMKTAFSWFLGNNHLHQIIYNPCTGGCYDGLEETQVNLNQGAESTVSYLMARLTMEKEYETKQHVTKKTMPRHNAPYPKMKLLNPGKRLF